MAGLKSKVDERKIQDLLVTCLYFFGDINYYVIKFFYSLGVGNEFTVSCSVDMSTTSTCSALKLVSRLLVAKKTEINF